MFSYPELAPSQACALICLATRASSRSLHGSLTLSLPHANPLFRTLTLCLARGMPRRRSDERVYVQKSGPKLQVVRPGLEYAASIAPTATRQGLVGLLQRGNALASPALHEILGRVQCLSNRFNALLTSATLHASLSGYEYAGGDPLPLPAPRNRASRCGGSSNISRS